MKIIDLSQELYSGMPVFPGDPQVSIESISSIEDSGFLLRKIEMNTHDGTHVNVPSHCEVNGKTLSDIELDNFSAVTFIYKKDIEFNCNNGVIFREQNIDKEIMHKILNSPPKFVGLSDKFDFDLEIEKELLKNGIISFEKLANTESLPNKFLFLGMPLKIRNGDGSPVRAFAIID